jgi:hypothetical protein
MMLFWQKQDIYQENYKNQTSTKVTYFNSGGRTISVPSPKANKKKQNKFQSQINRNPKGDFDGDSVPNSVDRNDFDKKPPKKKQVISQKEKEQYETAKATKAVIAGAILQAKLQQQNPPSSWFASSGDYTKVAGPGGSVIWYKAYWDKDNGNGIQYKFDHVQYNGVNYKDVPDVNNPKSSSSPIFKDPGDKTDWRQATKKQKEMDRDKKGSQGPRDDGDGPTTETTPMQGSPLNKSGNSTRQGGDSKKSNNNNPAQTVKTRNNNQNSNSKKEGSELKISGNGNGDNLTRLFQKAYGDRANSVMNTTLGIMRSHGGGEIKEIGKPGQYGYTIAVKTKDGWSTDINAVKNKLVTYVPDSFEGQNLPSDKLTLAATGGLETSLSNRFARAFHGGDTQKGNQSLMAAYNALKAKNPGKVRFVGTPGQVGSYIQVKVNGEWTSNSDEVAKQLSAYAKPEQSKGSANLSKQQKDLLAGANGNAVLNSFINKYGSVELAQKNLKIAMNSFEKANPGNDIRYFGNIGQPGFYIEVKTKDGWVNGTNRILNKLEDHMPKVAATPPVNSPSNASTPESAFAPGATGPNQSASPAQPATSSTSSPEESAETASPSQPVASSNVEPSEEQGLQIGFEAGSPEFQQSENSLNEWAANRTQETESFKPSKEKPASVDLGQAARKSEAMMAFDLDGSGDISAAEKALMANGDQNNNGIVGEYGLKKFVAQADTNNSGLVSQAEVKAYNVVDTNNNNKLSAREIKAYGNVDANNDGDITKKEAKAMVKDLRAQVDLSKQEKKDLDLAKQYLAKSNGKSGGADNVDAQVAALVNSQPKHDKKGDTGPKGATKKNK